jgi:hypothetical protein
MDPRLSKLILDYQGKVAEAVAVLENAGYPRPSSDSAWAGTDGPPHGELTPRYHFFKHGFGCAVHGPGWKLDFDFGEGGQIDGFDPSRLKGFAAGRLDAYGLHSEREIDDLFARARDAGEVVFSGYILSYLARSAG